MKKRYSNDLKREVLNNGTVKAYKALAKEAYFGAKETIWDTDLFGEVTSQEIWKVDAEKALILKDACKVWKDLDCARCVVESLRQRKKRAKTKTTPLIESANAVFVTLTFSDATFEKHPTEKNRRDLVSRYLKANCSEYVANVDYGDKNGREHYHALTDGSLNLEKWHKYGAIKVERVRVSEDSKDRIPKYITKLTQHAMKESGFGKRLIYSRKRSKMDSSISEDKNSNQTKPKT